MESKKAENEMICVHEYREISAEESRKKGVDHFGACYHVCECKKCGNIVSYDSGD